MPRRSLHGPPSPVSSVPSCSSEIDPDLAEQRARERLDAARRARWPLGCTVIRDTREQQGWSFPLMEEAVLKAGDYSVKGLENEVCIERKNLADAYASIGNGRGEKFKLQRDRFRREWERMAEMRYSCVIIEGTMEQLARQPDRTLVKPATVIGTYRRWSIKYGVPVWFGCTRQMSQRFAGLLVVDFWKMWSSGALP